MDASLLGYEDSLHHWSCPSSDSEFYSMSSPETISPETVSPAPSVDFVFSPPKRSSDSSGNKFAISESLTTASKFLSCSAVGLESTTVSAAAGRPIRTRSRSRNPSKQRQSASEKEKLRMRDLTKALHHLRSYLPASVAPLGQTLTKIETLRLTIRYISHLSAQLGTSEHQDFTQIQGRRPTHHQDQGLQQQQQAQRRSPSGGMHRVQEPHGVQRQEEAAMRDDSHQGAAPQQILGYFQCASSTVEGMWRTGQENRCSGFNHQQQLRQGDITGAHRASQDSSNMGRGLCQYGSSVQMPIQNETYSGGIGIDYLFQTTPAMQTTQSCQMYNRDFGYQLVPQAYWS